MVGDPELAGQRRDGVAHRAAADDDQPGGPDLPHPGEDLDGLPDTLLGDEPADEQQRPRLVVVPLVAGGKGGRVDAEGKHLEQPTVAVLPRSTLTPWRLHG